jgi:hypothetical protein
MPIDLTTKTDQEIANLIENHRKKGITTSPLYLAVIAEQGHRNQSVLEPDRSRAFILAAARERRFLGYGQLAEASGATWAKARRAMPGHLWSLISQGHDKGWPMLSAIVVDKPNIATGKMEASALKGFIKAAHELGRRDVDADGKKFLRDEQERLFQFVQENPIE